MRAFWKLLDEDDQRHLRIDAWVRSEAAFWRTRAWQIAKEEKMEAKGDHGIDDWNGRATVCRECRGIESRINEARNKETT
jgi:hypothetical protein